MQRDERTYSWACRWWTVLLEVSKRSGPGLLGSGERCVRQACARDREVSRLIMSGEETCAGRGERMKGEDRRKTGDVAVT